MCTMEKLFWILFIFAFRDAVCMFDPCTNYTNFPDVRLGSRNQHCVRNSIEVPLCDFFIEDKWYVSKDAVLSNMCPPGPGSCGVTNPAYLDGKYPDVSEDIVNRVACIKQGSSCCNATVPIQIKNCTGFYVYHLKPLKDCSNAYCFDSSLPCVVTTTTSTTLSTSNIHEKNNDDHNSKGYLIMIIGSIVGSIVVCLLAIAAVVAITWSKKRITVAEMPSQDKNKSMAATPPPPYSPNENYLKKP